MMETDRNGPDGAGGESHTTPGQPGVDTTDDGTTRAAVVPRPGDDERTARPPSRDVPPERGEGLPAVTRLVLAVGRAVTRASSRDDLETAVVDAFAASDLYRGARIGVEPAGRGTIRWTAAAGLPQRASDDLEALADGIPGTPRERDGRLAVPLGRGDEVRGVLVLAAGHREPPRAGELALLGEVGATIAHGIAAIERERLLAADAVVELELGCRGAGAFAAALSGRTGRAVALEGLIGADDGPLAYYAIDDVSTGVPAAVAGDTPAAAGARLVRGAGADGPAVVEVSLTDRSVVARLLARGATVTAVRAAEGRCRLTAEVAPAVDVRELIDAVGGGARDVDLLAKAELDRPVTAEPPLSDGVVGDLTGRQQEALEAAYRAGYFEWPRASTAEEVAASMGITGATLHHHLRKALRKLLAAVLDDDRRRPVVASP